MLCFPHRLDQFTLQYNINLYWLTPYIRLRLKSSSLHVFLHGNISADDCARELFKPSKDLASLHICNENNIFGLGFGVFCE